MCHEDIYTELYINNNNKLAIICSGLPSNYDESNLIKYLGINNYDTLSFHYRNTGLSGGLIFDPKSDIENLIDFYSKKYASITLFVNSFAASPVMDLKSETVLKLSKIIFVSPAFNLSKVSDIKTLPDFIEAHKKYMYRFTSDFFTKFIYIDKTKIVNKLNCKVFVIHGKDDKQITMDSVEKLQKKIGFELIKVKEGHMSFNKLVKYHLDILYDLL
jgi:pimeloyl-ACP methyl ester carboxylesterase